MSSNKLVIDLGGLKLTGKQRKDLQKALHRTVAAQLKKSVPQKDSIADESQNRDISIPENSATLTVTFTNTDIKSSELKAILNGNEQTINKSGKITFPEVKTGDIIAIQVTSLGTTTVTIDVNADPVQMNFPPGHHNDQFFVN